MKQKPFLLCLLVMYTAVFIWSAIGPKDYFTWFLEVIPALAGLVILAATYKKFKFTNFVYLLILIHCCILFVGGHYTYAEVPLFDHIKDLLHGTRNNYDKVGHFAQGFVPALIAREIIVRLTVVNRRGWTGFLVVSICLAISAFYEFIEWWAALLTGESAEAFLGTQGYAWDTQSDMFYAFMGAILAVVFFSRYHDRAMACGTNKISAKLY